MVSRTIIITLFIIAVAMLLALYWFKGPELKLEGVNVVVFKDPFCGCCEEYVKYLKGLGVRIDVITVPTIESKLREFKIPESLWSCHITVVEGYIVVGHIPAEAIEKLLIDKPPVRGISLPGMPSGSPGMPGQKVGPFTIYSFNDKGEINIYITI